MSKKIDTNKARISFDACSINEGFARMVVMGFMMDMNPTMDELTDVKTAVSEAVTNAIIHGYEIGESTAESCDGDAHTDFKKVPQVEMVCLRDGDKLTVIIEDHGVGIGDIEEARQPFFTTKPDMERSGMGFSFMEAFMDEVEVVSKLGKGTRITMSKYIKSEYCNFSNQDAATGVMSEILHGECSDE